jgi:hypothetical protein
MVKCFAVLAGALVAVSLVPGRAQAQVFGPGVGRPTVSPYVNLGLADGLGQLGISGGYQTLVRPFTDGRKATNANAAAISRLQTQVGGAAAGGVRPTGAGFYMNYSHYYPGLTASGR